MATTAVTEATTTAAAAASVEADAIPKSVITISILVAGFLLGILVAKLVNYCYNRADVPDNASDISEHTKGLLRIQLALLKFGKGGGAGAGGPDGDGPVDSEEAKRQQQATVLSMWKMKAMNKAQQRAQEADEAGDAKAAATVKVVDEAPGNKKGKSSGAAGKKSGGVNAAGKTGGKQSQKAFTRPKKLFPNSVAGVAPAESSPAPPTPAPPQANAKEKKQQPSSPKTSAGPSTSKA